MVVNLANLQTRRDRIQEISGQSMVVERLTYSITQLLFATMKWASVPANPHDSSNLQEVRVPTSNKPRLELLYPLCMSQTESSIYPH